MRDFLLMCDTDCGPVAMQIFDSLDGALRYGGAMTPNGVQQIALELGPWVIQEIRGFSVYRFPEQGPPVLEARLAFATPRIIREWEDR